jgi:hypothetical protein
MTEHYVTLFDSLFVPQGMALHASLQRHGGEHRLWVLCVDELTHEVLTNLALPNVSLISLAQVETPEMLAVKPGRSKGEYCWTLTPFAPRFVFEADPTVARVTYLDADLWFLKNPAPILREFEASGAAVLITDHAYAPEFDQSAEHGQYCVQFMTFVRDRCEPVRKWWEERCIEWCFGRAEDGKFGDQKYLDDWTYRFDGLVHVLAEQDRALAPWNATRFPIGRAVFFHFHGLRILAGRRVDLSPNYPLPTPVIRHVYEPYVRQIAGAAAMLGEVGFTPRPQGKAPRWIGWLRRCVSGAPQQLRNWHRVNFRRY